MKWVIGIRIFILAWNEFERKKKKKNRKRKIVKDSRGLKDYYECNADVLFATKLCKFLFRK